MFELNLECGCKLKRENDKYENSGRTKECKDGPAPKAIRSFFAVMMFPVLLRNHSCYATLFYYWLFYYFFENIVLLFFLTTLFYYLFRKHCFTTFCFYNNYFPVFSWLYFNLCFLRYHLLKVHIIVYLRKIK